MVYKLFANYKNSRSFIVSHGLVLIVFSLLSISVYASSADLDVVDDGGSIYNGDENHKVWSGSQDRLDEIGTESPYDFFSSTSVGASNGGGGIGNMSTLGRAPRARQISAPIPVPPPPKEELKKQKKDKKSKMASSQSLSGTLIRPKPVHGATLVRGGPHHQVPMHHGPMGYGPQYGHHQLPPRQFHTISHRGMNGHGHPMNGHPMNGHPMNGHAMNGHGHPMNGHGHGMQLVQMQMHGPPPPHMHPQVPIMIPQQYATLQHTRGKKKSKKDKMNGGIPLGIPVPPPLFAYPQSVLPPESRPLSMSNRKLAQSAGAGLDDSGNSGAESPGGTGIYRRKGHLNERAFSYSIRQEHRSRSHGSLASLQFNPPDLKKEREIAQMVAGLDLNDDATIYRRTQQITNGGTFGKHRK